MNRHLLTLITIIFCLCQLSFAGEGFWETHGPYGGDMREVEFGGGTRGLCYVGGEGGLFTSFDDGATWENRTPDLPYGSPDMDCDHISACPAQPGLVYAAFGDYYESELYISENAGADWALLEVPSQFHSLFAIACDPNDPDRVYVAYSERQGMGRSSEGEVFRSLSAGRSWEFLTAVVAECICVDPNDSETIWMSCYPEGPMRSTNGGITWEILSDGLAGRLNSVRNICISPSDSDDVLLCAANLFKWNAAESSWELFGFGADDAAYAPTDPSRIYVCDYDYVYFSDDGGESWEIYPAAQRGASIAVSHYDPDDILLADRSSGVWRSDDGCETLTFSSDGISLLSVHDLVACDTERQVLVCCGDYFTNRSLDGGAVWTLPMISENIVYPGGFCIGQDPANPHVLYLADPYPYMFYESGDAGETWNYVGELPWYAYYVNGIAVDPKNSKRIYLAVDGYYSAAHRSVDGGVSWEALNIYPGGEWDYAEGRFVQIDPRDSTRVFVGTSEGLYLSENDGESFSKVRNLGGFVPDFLEFELLDLQTIYCGRNTTSGANRPALCVSCDGGGTWAPIDTPVTAVCAIAINPDDGAEFYIAGDSSLHHTIDSGEVWLPLVMDGFDCPVSTVILIDFDHAGNTIYATGYGVFSFFDVGAPFVSLSVSQPVYAAGDMFHLSCNITNPGASSNVDLIVWIELPGGTNVYLPGLGLNRVPFYSGWLPGRLSLKDYALLEAPVAAGLPLGDYTVFAVLYEQGTDEQLSNIAAETFTMVSAIE